MYPLVIGTCPVCNSEMHVTRLACDACGTSMEGHFRLDPLSQLTDEHKHFVLMFMKSRGNIKELEKALGVSYPTVRRTLDQVIEALGFAVRPEGNDVDRKSILEALSEGEITSEEAMKRLRGDLD